jgi:hypothetical protein
MRDRHFLLRFTGRILFVLWCATWPPLFLYSMMESPGDIEPAWQRIVHFVFAVSGVCYFVGGSVWLIRKSHSASARRSVVALLTLFMLSPLGPVTLVACASMVRPDWREAEDADLAAAQP